jgi:hypothetical protein
VKEALLHYAWQYRQYYASGLRTTEGETVEIIDPGLPNIDAGPDFFNAKVRIGDTLWAGNVEIHIVASDWFTHGHHNDRAYNSVILHVVNQVDTSVTTSEQREIPQLVLPLYEEMEARYTGLMDSDAFVSCAPDIQAVPRIIMQAWKSRLMTERLEQKTDAIMALLSDNRNDWEESFYISLSRHFGMKVNNDAFERLAKSLPQRVLGKHKHNLFQIESLLFGQAGLLDGSCQDDYGLSLQKEYHFLQTKYQLSPIDGSQWKLLRLRPVNFPHVRIAQLAALIHGSSGLFARVMAQKSVEKLREMLACEPSEYWQTHYIFGKPTSKRAKKSGTILLNTLIINTISPFLFVYGRYRDNEQLAEKAISLLEQLPGEVNRITRGWSVLGIPIRSAFDSQSLLQLKIHYCDRKDCLRCRIGHAVLTIK